MLRCNNCKVDVAGQKRHCPLCQGDLSGVSEINTEVFPKIIPPPKPNPILVKTISFAAIVISVLSVMINYITSTEVMWCWFVVAGAICAWVTAMVTVRKRRNVLKCIAREELIVIPIAIFWDILTGWQKWSLTYVYPSVCVAVFISMFVLASVLKYPPSDYIVYLVFNSILGIVPIIFMLTDMVSNDYASEICIAFSVITLAGLLLFGWRSFRQEASRKFHI